MRVKLAGTFEFGVRRCFVSLTLQGFSEVQVSGRVFVVVLDCRAELRDGAIEVAGGKETDSGVSGDDCRLQVIAGSGKLGRKFGFRSGTFCVAGLTENAC